MLGLTASQTTGGTGFGARGCGSLMAPIRTGRAGILCIVENTYLRRGTQVSEFSDYRPGLDSPSQRFRGELQNRSARGMRKEHGCGGSKRTDQTQSKAETRCTRCATSSSISMHLRLASSIEPTSRSTSMVRVWPTLECFAITSPRRTEENSNPAFQRWQVREAFNASVLPFTDVAR